MAAPTYFASGSFQAGTGSITPPFPANTQADDIALLVCESENQVITLTTANGFVEVTGSPQGTGTAGSTGSTRLAVYWKRLVGGDSAPVVADPGDHVTGQIHVFRGCITSGNPWNVTAGAVETSSDTSGSIPTVTTTVDNCLIVALCSTSNNATSTANFSAWANANLTGVAERADNSNTAGLGGGHGMATGVKATAGATGATTVTYGAASLKGLLTIALLPDPNVTVALTTVVGTSGVGSVYRPFSDIRQEIINGLTSAQSEAHGWNAEVRDKIPVTDVVRTSNTIVTITLDAEAAYDISAQETITATVPASALVGGGSPLTATPTFTVDPVTSGVQAALTGVAGTSGRGSVLAATALAITTVLGTSAAGTPRGDHTVALTGVSATAAAGTPLGDRSITPTGVASTSAVNTTSTSRTAALPAGVAGTSAVGTVTPSVNSDQSFALTGIAGSTQVGNVTVVGDLTRGLTGVSGASAVGTVAPTLSAGLTGAIATPGVGTPSSSRTVAVTGTPGTSAVGTPAPTWTMALSGVATTPAVGNVVVIGDRTVALSGVSAQVTIGTFGLPAAARGVIAKASATVALRASHAGTISIRRISGTSVMDTYTMANGNDPGMASGTLSVAMAPLGS